ncbi:hypothetical protein C7410_12765 [Paraburkholderia silvatlantica]|uniref:Tfp pilus assembly protein PilO n=1 Tax=Paraburkholderia silvatlantica TaxID=321895 RepID=A0A2V4TMA8_9BURK|nr:hypothetical protein [Paraburkholderia silvatlantica]PYE17131.1 hypothetical protein C7410_12765 [Paraburkholderia silvatlantica]
MSTMPAHAGQERALVAAQSGAHNASRGWPPLHAWSLRHRLAVDLTIAVLVLATVSGACVVGDPLGVHAAREALEAAQKRNADARKVLARLPALRDAAARTSWRAPHAGNSADDIRRISQLAAQSDLVVQVLEPGVAGGAQTEAFRSVKLVAQGTFAQLRRLLEGLAREPALTVPSELAIRRIGTGLSVSATLHVYDALAAVPLAAASAAAAVRDPFAQAAAAGRAVDGWRLAGILRDRQRILALLETPDGVMTAQAGEAIGDARVLEIGPARVVVAARGTMRALGWAEPAK